MDLAEAIDRLVELGQQKAAKIEPDPRHAGRFLVVNGDGSVAALAPNPDAQASAVQLSSLSSFADFIRENRDDLDLGELTVVVESHRQVALVGALDDWKRRATYLVANAPKPDTGGNGGVGQWLALEDALIWIATGFDVNDHQKALIAVLSNVIAEETNSIRDDGMAQQVEVKKGIAARGRETVPSPITLVPFCTFAEIPQPERQFLVRLKGGGTSLHVKLIPSGSGLWEAKTREAIAKNLDVRLEGIEVPVIY